MIVIAVVRFANQFIGAFGKFFPPNNFRSKFIPLVKQKQNNSRIHFFCDFISGEVSMFFGFF